MCTEKNSFKVSFIKTFKQHSLFQFTDLELEGFIHTLSPIKKANNKSKTPYFECLVQTSNVSKVRAVCDETKKRTTLHQFYSSYNCEKLSFMSTSNFSTPHTRISKRFIDLMKYKSASTRLWVETKNKAKKLQYINVT